MNSNLHDRGLSGVRLCDGIKFIFHTGNIFSFHTLYSGNDSADAAAKIR